MNIQTVIANLLNTIEGKEKLYHGYCESANELEGAQLFVARTMRDVLKTNLEELNAILADCMLVREADIVRNLEVKEKGSITGWEH